MARIKVIEHEEAEGRLKEIYAKILQKRGKLANVLKVQSLNPESLVTHLEFYMSIMFSKSPIPRPQREMIAVVVSSTNGCAYCRQHHGAALNQYWKDDLKVLQLGSDYTKLNLPEMDEQLCKYAEYLTKNPALFSSSYFIDKLKTVGLSDRGILDATLVISYFNYVNRMVLALGVELEKENGTGFKY